MKKIKILIQQKSNKKIREISKYLIVGFITVCIDLFAYYFFIIFIGISNENSKRISYFLGTLFAFFANKYFTFNSNKKIKNELVLFYIIYFFSFLINSVVHDIIWIKFEIDTAAFFIATFISIIFNFLGQKYVVFKR